MSIAIKRIYSPLATKDGYRVLIDRLWPRGIKKEEAKPAAAPEPTPDQKLLAEIRDLLKSRA